MVSVGVLCVQHGRKETDPPPTVPSPLRFRHHAQTPAVDSLILHYPLH